MFSFKSQRFEEGGLAGELRQKTCPQLHRLRCVQAGALPNRPAGHPKPFHIPHSPRLKMLQESPSRLTENFPKRSCEDGSCTRKQSKVSNYYSHGLS